MTNPTITTDIITEISLDVNTVLDLDALSELEKLAQLPFPSKNGKRTILVKTEKTKLIYVVNDWLKLRDRYSLDRVYNYSREDIANLT